MPTEDQRVGCQLDATSTYNFSSSLCSTHLPQLELHYLP